MLRLLPVRSGERCLRDFDTLVGQFLATTKIAGIRPRWQSARHSDYAKLTFRLGVPNSRVLVGRLVIAAHKVRTPPKYCFSLLFHGERILALDVNPGRSHRNLFAMAPVIGTHWQRWPKMEAEPEDRILPFATWLSVFLKEANISIRFVVLSPPRGVQMGLL